MTSPVEAIAITTTLFGCSGSTSTRWIVAARLGCGAVAIATRSVTWARAVVVSRIAASTSRRRRESSSSTPGVAGTRPPATIAST